MESSPSIRFRQLEHSVGSMAVQGWSQSNAETGEQLSLCTAPPASPCLHSALLCTAPPASPCLHSALSYRSYRIWPPSTPTSSSSRSVGALRWRSFAPVPLASAQAGHTLGAPCWEGAVPRGWCLQGHWALPLLGEQRRVPHGDTGSDLPCVGSAEVADPASIKAAAAKVGEHLGDSGLNLLINNAGIGKPNSLDNETLESMTQVYTTNTIGPLLMGQAFLPLLKKAAQGSPGSGLSCSKAAIVNMSSYAGSIEDMYVWDFGQVVSYRCSKVLPDVAGGEPRHFPLQMITLPSNLPLSLCPSLHCD
uniref:C-factor-like n=1 Tax=Cyanistes caeruleus TaxID=156563 RepID=A0A8C0UD97_CYACU